jgi:hypothetical protein
LQEEKLKLGGATAPPGLAPELQGQVEVAIDEAFVEAFRWMMAVCALLALVSAGVSLATITNEITHHEDGHQVPPHFEILG